MIGWVQGRDEEKKENSSDRQNEVGRILSARRVCGQSLAVSSVLDTVLQLFKL